MRLHETRGSGAHAGCVRVLDSESSRPAMSPSSGVSLGGGTATSWSLKQRKSKHRNQREQEGRESKRG